MRRARGWMIAAVIAALAAPACTLILGIEELPLGTDAGIDGGAEDARPDHEGAEDANDAEDSADAEDTSDAMDSGDADDASDAADSADADDTMDAPDADDAGDAMDAEGADDASDASDAADASTPGPCDCPSTQAWTKAFATSGDVTIAGVAVGANGHIVLAGSVSGDLDVQGQVLPGGADHDVFVMALDPCGDPLWARRYGDAAEQRAIAMSLDPPSAPHPNAILITGAHAGTLSFGGTAAPLVAAGTRAFVARLDDANGDGISALGAGFNSTLAYRGTSIAATPDGSAYWAGTEASDSALFLRRLDPSMSVTNEITPACSGCSALVAPIPGGVALAGWFQGTLDLVAGGGGVLVASGADVLAASLVPQAASFSDPQRKAFGDIQSQKATSLVTSAGGDHFLAGEVAGMMQWSGLIKVTSTGGIDAFAGRLDASLAPVWLAGFGGGGADQRATALALGNRLAVAGDFAGSLSASAVLLSAGGTDAFLLTLDPATGTTVGSISFGGPGDDHAAGVALDASGHAIVAGVLGAPAFFGCGTLGGPGKSVFVAKRPIP